MRVKLRIKRINEKKRWKRIKKTTNTNDPTQA